MSRPQAVVLDAEDTISFARSVVRAQAPYLMAAILALIPEATTQIPTMSTSEQMVMLYNPKWVARHSPQQIAAVLVHEVSHVLRKHHKRFAHVTDPKDFKIANIAMDMAINVDLRNNGWDLPKCAYYPASFNLKEGLIAEEYYALLQELRKNGKGANADKLRKALEPKVFITGDSGEAGEDGEGDGVTGGACGGCSTGDSDEEREAGKSLGRSDAEMEAVLLKTAHDIKEHLSQPGRGNMPGLFKEIADFLLEPKRVDWRHSLSSVIRNVAGRVISGGMDLSLRRPSKRSYMRGLLRPGMIQRLPEICIIRDTSGSMGYDQLKQATSESCHIIQSMGVDYVWFFDADTKGSVPEKVNITKLLKMPIVGRGGTDFVGPIEQALKIKPKPDIIIYMTDGDGGAPLNAPPGVEVVWCIVSSYYNKAPAKWGHHVFLGEKKK